MLSRERLSIAVQDPSPYRPEDAEEMIDAFAHELAERIRALRGGTGDIAQTVSRCADLIDPEVET